MQIISFNLYEIQKEVRKLILFEGAYKGKQRSDYHKIQDKYYIQGREKWL